MNEYHYHFWCQTCQHEYSESQSECKEVDTPWGDGRWWFCPHCGSKMVDVHVYSDAEQALVRAVTEMLVRLESMDQVPAAEIYNLLLNIGHAFLPFLGNCRETCQYFYNAREFAQKHDLPESARAVDYKRLAYQFNVRDDQYQVLLPLPQLLEYYLQYFLPI